ncbi:uncharacterized protein LOC112589707 [Harpegnathos saltator]|uniref:uncharacterized protein LOC112589707 n=1 Tax=Harpegnathos saltator TaxID=610380 RepID=UPI000DBEE8CD|nr:uncharacterized protein LOC112589707 [Harpegnathos saltator]
MYVLFKRRNRVALENEPGIRQSVTNSDYCLPKYPRELIDHAVHDRCCGIQKIAEADETVAVLIETVEDDLHVSGWVVQWEQFLAYAGFKSPGVTLFAQYLRRRTVSSSVPKGRES